MKNFSAARWFVLFTGILIVILGISMLFTPLESLIGLAVFIGIVMLISGLSEIASFLGSDRSERSGWMLTGGILSTILGIWSFFGSGISALTAALPFVFACGVLATSVVRTVGAVFLRDQGIKNWSLSLILGILGILFGFVLSLWPVLAGFIISYILAFLFIAHGAGNICMFFSIKRLSDQVKELLDLKSGEQLK